MTDVDAFLESVMPRLKEAETAIHNGEIGPRVAMWSRNEPLTVFGAGMNGFGWAEILPVFELLGERFSDCTSWEFELVAAEVGADFAYIVGFEHTTASVAGAPATPYSLRVTTIFRLEDDGWKIVHRHGDPYDGSARQLVSRLREPRPGEGDDRFA